MEDDDMLTLGNIGIPRSGQPASMPALGRVGDADRAFWPSTGSEADETSPPRAVLPVLLLFFFLVARSESRRRISARIVRGDGRLPSGRWSAAVIIEAAEVFITCRKTVKIE
jgi:hypothetical protein